jgi:inorganic triphosphatase YgiF
VSAWGKDIELEAKFKVADDSTVAHILTTSEINGVPLSPLGSIKHFTDVYIDTDDNRLRAAGWTLRLRVIPGEGILASIKSITPVEADGVHLRTEIEEFACDSADPRDWPESSVKQKALELLGDGIPTRRAAVDQHRQVREIHLDGLVAEMSIDDVRVTLPGSYEPLARWFEIEVEAVEGTREQLDAIAVRIGALPGLTPERRSKGERALGLSANEQVSLR